ncbi:hypothetical protein [Pseudoalteromonas phage J2-1_QLiu-2017]|nr:hypothetical protein [Pseudoalteromonas phage J2-1_QLiu-2017]
MYLTELEVEYNYRENILISLTLRDTAVHKSVNFHSTDKGTLVSVVGQDVVSENTKPKSDVLKEPINSVKINDIIYESPFDMRKIYTDLTGEVLPDPEEEQEESPAKQEGVAWWASLSYDDLKKACSVNDKLFDRVMHRLVKEFGLAEELESELLDNPTQADDSVTEEESLVKFKGEEKVSLEIVYEPYKLDAHNQWMSAETIEAAKENFNLNLAQGNLPANLFHSFDVGSDTIEILRTYTVPVDCIIGEEKVVQGTWIAELKWHNDTLWKMRTEPNEDGVLEIAGVSIGALGKVIKTR